MFGGHTAPLAAATSRASETARARRQTPIKEKARARTQTGKKARGRIQTDALVSVTADLDDPNEVYQMGRGGIAYIFNNKKFPVESEMGERKGTDVDAKELHKLWTDFGFKTTTFDDYSAADMKSKLKDLAKLKELNDRPYDCVIVCILTHGGDKAKLAGSDGNFAYVHDLVALFNEGVVHPSLDDKPRLFFIQACRGSRIDKGVWSDTATSMPDYRPDPHRLDEELGLIPIGAHMLIGYSTTPGYVSWRQGNGSWFIQGIVKVFKKFYDKLSLDMLMPEVNNYVSEFFGEEWESKQISSFVEKLTKSLYFRAGSSKTG